MSKITIEINEDKLHVLICEYLAEVLGTNISIDDVTIEVKSKQNYKSEWEKAAFRAIVRRKI